MLLLFGRWTTPQNSPTFSPLQRGFITATDSTHMKKQRLIKQKLAQECTSSLLCSDGCFFAFLLQLRLKLFCLPFEPTSLSHSIAQPTLTLHKFSLGLGRTRAQRLCHGMVWPARIEENKKFRQFKSHTLQRICRLFIPVGIPLLTWTPAFFRQKTAVHLALLKWHI